jgi:hypothetical protein
MKRDKTLVSLRAKFSVCLSTTPWTRMGEWIYISTRLINLCEWRWVVSFTPRSLYPQRKSPWYPLDKRLGGPQSRSGRGGKRSKTPASTVNQTSVVQPVAYSLYWLSYPGSWFLFDSALLLLRSSDEKMWQQLWKILFPSNLTNPLRFVSKVKEGRIISTPDQNLTTPTRVLGACVYWGWRTSTDLNVGETLWSFKCKTYVLENN